MPIYKSLADWVANTSLPGSVSRSASDWQPNASFTVLSAATVGGTGFQPLVGRKVGRKTVVISNIGTNAATIWNGQNPPGSIGVLLGVGAVWVLDTEGEVWIRSQLGTIVDVVETYTPISDPSNAIAAVGRVS